MLYWGESNPATVINERVREGVTVVPSILVCSIGGVIAAHAPRGLAPAASKATSSPSFVEMLFPVTTTSSCDALPRRIGAQ